MTPEGPAPTVRLTTWRTIALAVLVGAVVAWALFFGLDRLQQALPVPPVIAAGTLVVVAVGVGWQARLTHRTLHRGEGRLPPTTAVALLALGKTALIAGAVLAGGYAAIAIHALPNLDAQLPRDRIVGALASLVAAIGLAVAGRMLERACEIPNPPPEDQSATPTEDPGDDEVSGLG